MIEWKTNRKYLIGSSSELLTSSSGSDVTTSGTFRFLSTLVEYGAGLSSSSSSLTILLPRLPKPMVVGN